MQAPRNNHFKKVRIARGQLKANLHTPSDAEYALDEIFFKEGAHGFVYRWNGEEWRKTELSKSEIKNLKTVVHQ